MADVERVCFVMHLRPDRVDDYLAAHDEVWPEMLDALRDTGWHNYSLFLRADDGMVVGYLETDDFERATATMAETAVNARWQAVMSEYFRPPATPDGSGAHPATDQQRLTEYFHLT
ncbi:L-rhamnose mutarotase [Mycolicibacterium sediminis]|uniref:L-rhamnose mutarotase n=1 Tax=Mycolicibacterium sediminis TaxID=1286180 RepID=A0A7I7QPP0_9MYCO|nr:L-rhamnose mutarotase [Mycolicibacterium sediminis]BBY27806.1 L-rhamnose mutarotase [Mycolicibacterium sediminis]